MTFFDRLQVISYILDKLYFYFAAIGLGGQREWFWYGFCVGLAGGVWDMQIDRQYIESSFESVTVWQVLI